MRDYKKEREFIDQWSDTDITLKIEEKVKEGLSETDPEI
jgi:hypothetical protein